MCDIITYYMMIKMSQQVLGINSSTYDCWKLLWTIMTYGKLDVLHEGLLCF